MISHTLEHEINDTVESLTEALKTINDFKENQLLAATRDFPKSYDDSESYDDHIVSIIALKHATNEMARNVSALAGEAEGLAEALIGEASLSGSYEYYGELEIPKTKVTDKMKLNYAIRQPAVKRLVKLVSELVALKWFFKKEVELLESTELRFVEFSKRLKGM